MPKKLDFITPTLMTLLDLFLSDPMREYHEREVVRRARVSKGSANRILRLLAGLDLLIRERKGRMVFYRLNSREAVARQFKVLVNVFTVKRLVDQIKEDCRRIVLFGSCAQGVDAKDSGIDLFVLTSMVNSVRSRVSEFNRSRIRKITPIIVDPDGYMRLKRKDRSLYENVERGIVLWEKE